MRTLARIVLIMALAVTFPVATFAQESLWNELSDQMVTLYEQGEYSEAAKVAEEALKVAEKTFGSNHLKVATSLNKLAHIYRVQGKYAEAEPLYKRALNIDEKALGKDHPDVAEDLSNLGLLYHYQGKYAEAEPLYKRANNNKRKSLWSQSFRYGNIAEQFGRTLSLPGQICRS